MALIKPIVTPYDSITADYNQMEALKKVALEGLRVVVLAVIPVVILGLEQGNLDWRLVALTGLIAGLRFVDKLLHEMGKESGDERLVTGLTRF